MKYTRVNVDSARIRVNDNMVGYVGGHDQGPGYSKFTGRGAEAGTFADAAQAYGGANLTASQAVSTFTDAGRNEHGVCHGASADRLQLHHSDHLPREQT